MITIRTNDKKLEGKLDSLVNKQIPFASSQAVSNILTKIRDNELKSEYKRTFDKAVNMQFYKLFHAVARANVADSKRNGFSRAALKRIDSPPVPGTSRGTTKRAVDTSFMEFHVSGGRRSALRTKKAVPITKGVTPPLNIKRSKKTGRIGKARKASTLYKQEGAFTVGPKSGTSILFVRRGKKKKAAYSLVPYVDNKKKYNPMRTVRSGVKTRAKTEFTAAITSALRTARV